MGVADAAEFLALSIDRNDQESIDYALIELATFSLKELSAEFPVCLANPFRIYSQPSKDLGVMTIAQYLQKAVEEPIGFGYSLDKIPLLQKVRQRFETLLSTKVAEAKRAARDWVIRDYLLG